MRLLQDSLSPELSISPVSRLTISFQFTLRLKTLLDKKRVTQTRTAASSKAPANFVTLFEGFQSFDGDLNKLQVSPSRVCAV